MPMRRNSMSSRAIHEQQRSGGARRQDSGTESMGSGSGSGGTPRRSLPGGSRMQQQPQQQQQRVPTSVGEREDEDDEYDREYGEDDDDRDSGEGGGVMSASMVARIEALAGFKSFMQGLDNQPQAYSLDEFIRGAANAIKVRMLGVNARIHSLPTSVAQFVSLLLSVRGDVLLFGWRWANFLHVTLR